MIVTFSVENFRSFYKEETFSLIASKKLSGNHENHLVPIPGTDKHVLRAGVLYGANGAGKSNFFKALAYLRSIVLGDRKKESGTGREPFRFESEGMNSTFDIQFIAGDKLYRYGVILDDKQICEEWLLEVIGNNEKVIYERVTDENGEVTVHCKSLKGQSKKLDALMTIGGPKNQSFLATIRATLEAKDVITSLKRVIKWFNKELSFIEPDSNYGPLGQVLSGDSHFKTFASEFLKAASTGVDDLTVKKRELSEDELRQMMPHEICDQLLERTNEAGSSMVSWGENHELIIEKSEEHHFYLLTIQSVHQHESSATYHFDISDESDGTRRLLNLLPALHCLHTTGGIFVIDEVERSMHPVLIRKFLEFFLSGCGGEKRQLIVTTHESNLLDQDLLRRDEIWFSEKNKQGATSLYSLLDFKARKDLVIDKHYLKGRFGAIPFLAEIDNLMKREADHQ